MSSEEILREIRKDLQKMMNAPAPLAMRRRPAGQMHQTTDTSEKQFQELMNVFHEWMTSYQRSWTRKKSKNRYEVATSSLAQLKCLRSDCLALILCS